MWFSRSDSDTPPYRKPRWPQSCHWARESHPRCDHAPRDHTSASHTADILPWSAVSNFGPSQWWHSDAGYLRNRQMWSPKLLLSVTTRYERDPWRLWSQSFIMGLTAVSTACPPESLQSTFLRNAIFRVSAFISNRFLSVIVIHPIMSKRIILNLLATSCS